MAEDLSSKSLEELDALIQHWESMANPTRKGSADVKEIADRKLRELRAARTSKMTAPPGGPSIPTPSPSDLTRGRAADSSLWSSPSLAELSRGVDIEEVLPPPLWKPPKLAGAEGIDVGGGSPPLRPPPSSPSPPPPPTPPIPPPPDSPLSVDWSSWSDWTKRRGVPSGKSHPRTVLQPVEREEMAKRVESPIPGLLPPEPPRGGGGGGGTGGGGDDDEGGGTFPWVRRRLGMSKGQFGQFAGMISGSGAMEGAFSGGHPLLMAAMFARGMGGGIDQAVKSDSAGGVLGGVGNTAMMGGMMMGGPAGAAVAGFGLLVKTVGNATEKIQEWNEALHKSNIQFAQFSAAMTGVKVRQEIRDIFFSKERGNARADSAEGLARSMHKVKEALAPIEDAIANAKNEMMTTINECFVLLIEASKVFLRKFGLDFTLTGERGGGLGGMTRTARDALSEYRDSIPDRFRRL